MSIKEERCLMPGKPLGLSDFDVGDGAEDVSGATSGGGGGGG